MNSFIELAEIAARLESGPQSTDDAVKAVSRAYDLGQKDAEAAMRAAGLLDAPKPETRRWRLFRRDA